MSVEQRHPGDEQLLRFADGELAPAEARDVQAHLDTCGRCRSELEAIGRAGAEFATYCRELLPAPPPAWGDIRLKLARVDAPRASGHRWLSFPAWRWAPVAAAAALAVVAVVYQFRNVPSVKADAMLKKAVSAAETQPKPRRLNIRTRIRKFEDLKPLFEAAHYSWEDPLSARSFQRWRAQLDEKRDEVTRTADDCYRVRTSTEEGELVDAALKLRISDLRPVESDLQFRNNEWVNVTEAPAEPDASARKERSAEPPPATPVPSVPQPVEPPVTPGEELRVFAALHRMGADLGEPVDVTRTDNRIVVTGMGLDQERRRQIQDALSNIPGVVLRFPAETEAPAEAAQDATTRPEPSRLETQLEKYLGGGTSFAQFSEQVLRLDEGLMTRAHALRRLAQRFPPAVESGLGAQDRLLLGDMRADHAEALERYTVELERALGPALRALGARPQARQASAPGAPWQSAGEELFQTAREFDRLLGMLLGGAGGDVSSQDLPGQLQARLMLLAARAKACLEAKDAAR